MPQIQLLDGKKIPFQKSISGFELAKKISKSLEKSALIMEVDGELKDLSHEIVKDSKVRIITSEDKPTDKEYYVTEEGEFVRYDEKTDKFLQPGDDGFSDSKKKKKIGGFNGYQKN